MPISKINTTSITDNSVTAGKIVAGAVDADIAAGSIDTAQIADDAVTSAKINYPLTGFSSTGIDDNADATAITIDSNEGVNIGKTSAALGSVGLQLSSTGYSAITTNHNTDTEAPLRLNRLNGDGALLKVFKDSSEVGSIGAFGAVPYFASSAAVAGGIRLDSTGSNGAIMPTTTTGANRDAATDLGYSSGSTHARFRDLYLSGGIQFDARSNKLDDYEEGSWTPTLVAVSGGALTVSAPSTGRYTKVGRLVTVSFSIGQFSVSGGTSGATINIGGLPFTTQGVGIDSNGSVIGQYNISWSRPDFVALRTYADYTLGFLCSNNGGPWIWETVSAFTGSNKYVNGTITYMTTQ